MEQILWCCMTRAVPCYDTLRRKFTSIAASARWINAIMIMMVCWGAWQTTTGAAKQVLWLNSEATFGSLQNELLLNNGIDEQQWCLNPGGTLDLQHRSRHWLGRCLDWRSVQLASAPGLTCSGASICSLSTNCLLLRYSGSSPVV